MPSIRTAIYFWHVDTQLLKLPLHTKLIRFLDHWFLTGWRYRKYVRANQRRNEGA